MPPVIAAPNKGHFHFHRNARICSELKGCSGGVCFMSEASRVKVLGQFRGFEWGCQILGVLWFLSDEQPGLNRRPVFPVFVDQFFKLLGSFAAVRGEASFQFVKIGENSGT